MIQPAMFALIRDGETLLYSDPCGSAFFARNLVWGPDELEQWLCTREPTEHFDSSAETGAVIDYDAMALLWYTNDPTADHPRSVQLLDVLIDRAWPEFEILYADGISDLRIAAGVSISDADDRVMLVHDNEPEPLDCRSETIEEELDFADGFDSEDESERFAWITILDQKNVVHHRLIGQITLDVIRGERKPLARLMSLPPDEVPSEINVTEGLIIDESSCEIAMWGSRDIGAVANEMTSAWSQWGVQTFKSAGYEQQCRISGPAGRPMSDARALGSVVPVLLMTERIDPAMMLGEIGRSFKGFMAKLVTGLTLLFCFPFVVFALVSGNWKAGGITIGIIVLLVTVMFKVIETKWRSGFSAKIDEVKRNTALPDEGISVAGPIDSTDRRKRLEQLLQDAEMPSIAEIEPYFEGVFPGVD